MAWRPRTPHEHSAGNGSTSPHPTAKVTAKRLSLALLLLALLALLLFEDGERGSEPQPVRLSPAIVTVEDINASLKAGQLTVAFDAVLTQATASIETLRYRIEAGDGKSAVHPLPPEGTVTFAPGEIRKSIQLSFQVAARSPRSIVLFGQSPGLSIDGNGRYNIMLADAVPARKVPRKKPAPQTAVKAEPSRFAAKSESALTPPPAPAEQPSAPDDADDGGAAIPSMPVLDERHAGLAFVKLDADGKPLADQAAEYSATPWSCVFDTTTALVWEIKRDDGGLHDRDWTYTWYDPRGGGGNAGTAGKGFCGETLATGCDTEKFAAAVNSAGLCGANDWRLPTQEELQSIVALHRSAPSVDRALFPNTQPSWYWSSSPVASDDQHAWIIGFYHGYDVWGRKSHDFYVRLVRRATNTSFELSGRANQ